MKPLKEQVRKALDQELFSGAAAGVIHRGELAWEDYWGQTHSEAGACSVQPNSYFDLASLTKVFATSTFLVRALAENKFKLETRIAHALNANAAGYETSLEALLAHQAGFEAHVNLKKIFGDPIEDLPQKILSRPAAYPPRDQTVYTDLGFILLGLFLEHRYQKSFEKLVEEHLKNVFDVHNMFFNPLAKGVPLQEIVATADSQLRKGTIHGEVHDDNAHLLNGAAGHAGLFGTLQSCLKMGTHWLESVRGKASGLDTRWAKVFASPHKSNDGQFRGLGWDMPTPKGSTAGDLISAESIGHLGYTGTSIWIDLPRETVVVFLSNRVYPRDDHKEEMFEFRRSFHDALWKELDHRNQK